MIIDKLHQIRKWGRGEGWGRKRDKGYSNFSASTEFNPGCSLHMNEKKTCLRKEERKKECKREQGKEKGRERSRKKIRKK